MGTFSLIFLFIFICIVTFVIGIIKFFNNKDSNSTAIKLIIISLIGIVISLIIGVNAFLSACNSGGGGFN